MAKSPVPAFPLRDSTFHKTCARNAVAVKLRRLKYYLALDGARHLFRTQSRSDWLVVGLIALAVSGRMAGALKLPYASQLELVTYSSAAIFLISVLLGYGAQKLGLIDLACFRKESFKRDANSESGVDIHHRLEIPINESLTPQEHDEIGLNQSNFMNVIDSHRSEPDRALGAAVEGHEPPAEDPVNESGKTSQWQMVEIKNLGKIRYHISSSLPVRD